MSTAPTASTRRGGAPPARSTGPALLALLLAWGAGACVFSPPPPDRAAVADDLRARTGSAPRVDEEEAELPPGVELEQDVTREEAVATALWRNPDFQATLAQLEVSRAEVLNAGLFQDPKLWFIFPWGPKQFAWTVRLPIEELWLRPQRVAAATADAERVAGELVRTGLDLVRDVELELVDAALAEAQLALAREEAALRARRAQLVGSRARAGEVSPRDELAARTLATRARLDADERARAVAAARERLAARMGLDAPPAGELSLPPASELAHERSPEDLQQEALVARPEVRAAELALEAAAERAGLAKREGWKLTALIDGHEVDDGQEVSPGLFASFPLFSQRGATARADAQLELAARTYDAVRRRVLLEVRASELEWNSAREAWGAQREGLLAELERAAGLAQRAHAAGELSMVEELDARLELLIARRDAAALEARLRRARAQLERSVGERLDAPLPPSPEPAP